ncbi:probable serine/threonine-protein kinase At1g54610 [Rutidosis leptorrhynchoides]|uniref:probable serine/threonine-protein kinase At1g54610 n=1 Tax=Rutidosis leptorrhynchoides TaxID=125765 RepID=UPI003A98CFD9
MGGVCGKPATIDDGRVSPSSHSRSRMQRKAYSSEQPRGSRSKRVESFRVKSSLGEVSSGSIDKRLSSNSSRRVRDDHYEKKNEVSQVLVGKIPGIGAISKGVEGEQVVAGWPSWLVAVAGEAINGWLPRRADTFEKLDKIGQGTYSSVYKARDLTTNKIVALKRVRFDNMDPESVKFMAREILILRRLDHPNIIKLEGLITSRTSCSLYLVFEYMEHDLSGLASLPGVKFTEPQVKCYMKQLLSGLDHCHSRGVLHRDIKGSNLLIDNNGILKIADFGLATFFDHREYVPLTSRVVTLWYRPPELLLGATNYGVAVDLWSTGCILGELYAGKPIMPGRTEVEQLHKIFKLCGSPSEDYWRKSKLRHSTVFKPTQPYRRRIEDSFKDVPSVAIALMETLLAIDPSQRGTALFALQSEFFTTKPHACDPSSLPKYPPSKEIDAKLREEELRRQRAGGNGQHVEKESRGTREHRAVPVVDANAELAASMQRRHDRTNSASRSEYFIRNKDDNVSGFPIEQKKPSHYKEVSNHNMEYPPPPMRETFSGPLVAGTWTKSVKKYDDITITNRADLSALSGLVSSRTLLAEDRDKRVSSSQLESTNQMGRLSEFSQDFGHSRKHDRKDLSRSMVGPRRMESGRSSTKEPVVSGNGYKGNNKINFSGPLGASNVDQMLKDHDRHIQEAARRARLEKNRLTKLESEVTPNPIYVSSRRAK